MNIAAALTVKSAAFAIGAFLLWDAHRNSAYVCLAGSIVILGFAFLAWRDR